MFLPGSAYCPTRGHVVSNPHTQQRATDLCCVAQVFFANDVYDNHFVLPEERVVITTNIRLLMVHAPGALLSWQHMRTRKEFSSELNIRINYRQE